MPGIFTRLFNEGAASTREWLRDPRGREFLDALTNWRHETTVRLKQSDALHEIHRSQGKLEVLDKILHLLEDLNATMGQKGR